MKTRQNTVVVSVIVILVLCVFTAAAGSQETGDKESNPFGIDYDNPDKYLQPGKKTTIKKEYLETIRQEMSVSGKTMDDIRVIFLWKQLKFRKMYAQGKFIGKSNVNSILKEGVLTGHHDDGLLMVAVFREFGFPAVMVDAVGVQWAFGYKKGETEMFLGHVYVEVFVEGKWILLDTTSNRYIENYSPLDPVIPLPTKFEPKGFYVMLKGVDTAAYGIKSYGALKKKMKAYAKIIKELTLTPPKYTIKNL